MKIQANSSTQIQSYNSQAYKKISFTATPVQILNKLNSVENICPRKQMLLQDIAEFFIGLENKMKKNHNLPKTYDYNINPTPDKYMPEELINLNVRTGFLKWTTLKKFDKHLKETDLYCSVAANKCCTDNKNLSLQTIEALKQIGVENPEKITISIYS